MIRNNILFALSICFTAICLNGCGSDDSGAGPCDSGKAGVNILDIEQGFRDGSPIVRYRDDMHGCGLDRYCVSYTRSYSEINYCSECSEHGQLKCDDTCVDVLLNNQHCGNCETQCGAGSVCIQGTCTAVCGEGHIICGTECADIEHDPRHCSGCGAACGAGEVCDRGVCVSYCPENQILCGTSCVDIERDSQNCGGCGITCDTGYACDYGKCLSICDDDQVFCGDACVYTDRDPQNCGGCGTVCNTGYTCSHAMCVFGCSDGLTLCGAECVDIERDSQNCGGCGIKCDSGEACEFGQCNSFSCPYGEAILAGDEIVCGYPIRTAKDLVSLRDALLEGDLTKAPGAPESLTDAVFVVMNDIDLGEQVDWKGIGHEQYPLSGTITGIRPDVKISGTLDCRTKICGLFGFTDYARIKDLSFDIHLTSSAVYHGRVVGRSRNSSFENLIVDGDVYVRNLWDNQSFEVGGVCGYARDAKFDRVHSNGEMVIEYNDYTPTGGFTGLCRDCEYTNCLSSVNIKSNCDRTAGFSGIAGNVKFDNVAYIGRIEGYTSSDFARLGGLVGDNTVYGTYMDISNSRVVMQIAGRDAVGGMIGINQSGIAANIHNSLVIADIRGERYVSSMVTFSAAYRMNNVYSIAKVVGQTRDNVQSSSQFCSEGGVVQNGYYDDALRGDGSLVKTGVGGCDKAITDTIYYTDGKPILRNHGISLLDQLNENLGACQDETIQCNRWSEVLIDVGNIVGIPEIYAPWPVSEVLPGELEALKQLNMPYKFGDGAGK